MTSGTTARLQDFKNLEEILRVILEEISLSYDPSDSRNCNTINATACSVLDRLGLKVRFAMGYVVLDAPIGEVIDPLRTWIRGAHREEIVDLASLQLRGHVNDNRFAGDFFQGTSDIYKEAITLPPQNEWVDHAMVEKCLPRARLVRERSRGC